MAGSAGQDAVPEGSALSGIPRRKARAGSGIARTCAGRTEREWPKTRHVQQYCNRQRNVRRCRLSQNLHILYDEYSILSLDPQYPVVDAMTPAFRSAPCKKRASTARTILFRSDSSSSSDDCATLHADSKERHHQAAALRRLRRPPHRGGRPRSETTGRIRTPSCTHQHQVAGLAQTHPGLRHDAQDVQAYVTAEERR